MRGFTWCLVPLLCGLSITPACAGLLGAIGGGYAIGSMLGEATQALEPCSPRGIGTLPDAAVAAAQLKRAKHYAGLGHIRTASRCLDNAEALWPPGIPGIRTTTRDIAAIELTRNEKYQANVLRQLERAHRFHEKHPVLSWLEIIAVVAVGLVAVFAGVASFFI